MTLPLPPLPAALPSGTCLREFVLRSVLGHGGFGIVYLADDTQLGRRVAVKEYFPPALSQRGEDGLRVAPPPASAARYQTGLHAFMREARLLARFDQPGLVPVHHYWESNGTAYMVMPYVEGATLKDLCRSLDGPPDEAWLRRVLDGLLDTLEAMHEAHVYHRDVSPDNVMVGTDGRPVLLDLGAARFVQPDGTQTITALLKPSYAPIEQYAHDRELRQGPWTDLYAVAATMCFALTGQAPPTAAARAVRDLHRPLHTREALLARPGHPGFDAGWLAAIDAALALRPDDRPQSVAAWRALLRRGGMPAPAWAVPQAHVRDPGATAPVLTDSPTTQTAAPPPPAILDGLRAAAERRTLRRAVGAVTRSWPTSPFTRGGWARRLALLGAVALMTVLVMPPGHDGAERLPLAVDAALDPGEMRDDGGPAVPGSVDVVTASALAVVAAAATPPPAEAASPAAEATPDPAQPAASAPTPEVAAAASPAPAASVAPVSTHGTRVARAPHPVAAVRPRPVSAQFATAPERCSRLGFFAQWRCMAQACADTRWTQTSTCRDWRGDDRLQATQYRH